MQYGFQEYDRITPEQVLQKTTQEQIFEFVLEAPFSFAERYFSPFREDDKKPDCRFETRPDGTILFVDFGDTVTHRNCFNMVMKSYNVKLDSAIDIILSHFGLSRSSQDYTKVNTTHVIQESSLEDIPTILEPNRIPFQKRDTMYWSRFLIRTSELVEDGHYATNRVVITGKKGRKTINIFNLGYCFDFSVRFKIYQPVSVERYRWITNCTEDDIGNINNLPASGRYLFIKKSYKDYRVMKNLGMGLNIIWFQNEGCVPSIDILLNLVNRFEYIIIFFDNDFAGVKAAIKLAGVFNSLRADCAKMIHLPIYTNRRMTWKDPGEFISKEGQKDLIEVFKQITSWQDIHLL